jgi:hypothetical protein
MQGISNLERMRHNQCFAIFLDEWLADRTLVQKYENQKTVSYGLQIATFVLAFWVVLVKLPR